MACMRLAAESFSEMRTVHRLLAATWALSVLVAFIDVAQRVLALAILFDELRHEAPISRIIVPPLMLAGCAALGATAFVRRRRNPAPIIGTALAVLIAEMILSAAEIIVPNGAITDYAIIIASLMSIALISVERSGVRSLQEHK